MDLGDITRRSLNPERDNYEAAAAIFLAGIKAAMLRRSGDGKHVVVKELNPLQEIVFHEAARSYCRDLHRKTGLSLWQTPPPEWCMMSDEVWNKKTPLEKHQLIETSRADYLKEMWDRMPPHPPQGGKCLDIGVGSGFFLHKMQQEDKDHEWHGIDLPQKLPTDGTELDRHRLPNFREYDGKKLPYADNSFDAIQLAEVVHHMDKPTLRQFFPEVLRVLKPGGQLRIVEEYAGKRLDHSPHASMLPNDSPALLPHLLDRLFYPDHPSYQRDFTTMVDALCPWKDDLGEPVSIKAACSFNSLAVPIAEVTTIFTKK